MAVSRVPKPWRPGSCSHSLVWPESSVSLSFGDRIQVVAPADTARLICAAAAVPSWVQSGDRQTHPFVDTGNFTSRQGKPRLAPSRALPHSRCWTVVAAWGGMSRARRRFDARSPVPLALDRLESVDLALDRAITLPLDGGGFDRQHIPSQPPHATSGSIGCPSPAHSPFTGAGRPGCASSCSESAGVAGVSGSPTSAVASPHSRGTPPSTRRQSSLGGR